ncbi:T9SS type A sorting domain-containing protein [Aurantibacillus circumpalustris]|uniref:T9SS type A sorting domain-containing protein n=1 Tax=Aurantibacillus circumpalustris TaxID=3036359 RepID=UPI00295B1385|nr:PKD domain-containing protein [Aurantibacillus circumpalustris]
MKKFTYAAKLLFISLFFSGIQSVEAQCTASFTYTLGPNGMVIFTGSASPTNSTTSYFWYFLGSSNVVGPNSTSASATYSANGTYSVTFGISTTAPTCSINTTQTISVNNITTTPCSANYTYVTGSNGSVNFISTSTGTVAGTIYNWNFGDGSTGTGITPAHTYTSNGNKYVCLTITNSVSPFCTNTKCDSVLITNVPTSTTLCNANFSYQTGANGSVNFVSTSTGTTGSSYYGWNFGSSGSGAGIAPTYTFSSNGTYPVCLTMVSNTAAPNSCSNTMCYSVVISNVTASTSPCNANFNYTIGSNGSVNFASTSTGTTAGTIYSWNFVGLSLGSGLTPTYVYTSNGTKTVCLTISNATNNCTSSFCNTFVISNVTSSTTPCNANFTSVLGANGSANFASTSTGTLAGTIYYWNFGDGSTGTGLTPAHTYTANGPKVICLTITNSVTAFCTSTKCDSVLITNVSGSVTPCAPTVVYTLTKDTTTALTWYSYPSYPSNITNATWYWGDGTYTTSLYPTHTYSAAGTYSTCVTVSVSCGTVTATYCYVAGIFRSSETNDMITVNIRQSFATGIKNQTLVSDLINIYPNPNNGEFVLEVNSNGKGLKENTILIYNIMGEKVFEKHILANSKQIIDVSSLSNGTYLINVSSEAGIVHKKIVIQK